MKLFGLSHEEDVLNGIVSRDELFRIIQQYGPERTVGMGIVPDTRADFDPIPLTHAKVLADLVEFFKARGNKIHFLESAEYIRGAVPLARKIRWLNEILNKEATIACNSTLVTVLNEEASKKQIELNHYMTLGRFDHILENVIKHQPDLVFLTNPYAKKLWSKRQLHGVDIDEIYMDAVVGDTAAVELQKQELSSVHFNEPDYFVRIKRLFMAANENRVTYIGNPSFVGTFDFALPHLGLFEMYITNSTQTKGSIDIEGCIEDCLGTADFKGKLEPKGVVFVKRYQREITHIDGIFVATSPITYSGFTKCDEFIGTYQGKYCSMGNFRMKEVSPEWRKFTQSQSP